MAKQEKSAAELYREERKARLAKAAKKNAKKSHKVVMNKTAKTIISLVVVIAIVLGVGAVAINATGLLERGKTIMTVGEKEVDKYEYLYYYTSSYSNFAYQAYYYSMYGMDMGYDYLTLPSEQPYPGEIEGVEEPTYDDYFKYSVESQLKYAEACRVFAEENGIKLEEADYEAIDKTLADYEQSAATADETRKYSLASYLRAVFGKGMTVDLLRGILEDQQLIKKVEEFKTEELKAAYTDEQVEEAYLSDLNGYAVVDLRSYTVAADKVKKETTAEDGTSSEAEEVTKETLAAAKTKADAFVAGVSDIASFKALASQYEQEKGNADYKKYLSDDELTLLEDKAYADLTEQDEEFFKWAFSKDAKVGSTFVTEDATKGYTVYMMEAPVHKAPDEITYDVRHILLKYPEEAEETVTDGDVEKAEVTAELLDTAAYEGVTVDLAIDPETVKDAELYMQAQDILKEYLDGDRTEDAFAELAKEYSEDGNAAEGGIYEDVTKGYMVPEFESWAFEKGREAGDVGIVETSFGYHIMYFIKTETTTWSDTIKSDLASVDVQEFFEELTSSDSVEITVTDEAQLEDANAKVLSYVKNNIANYQAQSTAGY